MTAQTYRRAVNAHETTTSKLKTEGEIRTPVTKRERESESERNIREFLSKI